jgi:hypothetical protein
VLYVGGPAAFDEETAAARIAERQPIEPIGAVADRWLAGASERR